MDSTSSRSIEELETEKYRRIYDFGVYRQSGPGSARAPKAIEALGMNPGESVIDYGCGLGDTGAIFHDAGLQVVNTDIVNVLKPDVAEYIPFVEGPMWTLGDRLPETDWAFSSSVLEHIPPEKVDEALEMIAAKTTQGAYLDLHHRPDVFGRYIDDKLHLTIEPSWWWKERIERHFDVVAFDIEMKNGEENTTQFVCRKRDPHKADPFYLRVGEPIPKSNASVVIVGHGPSMLNSGRGKLIDSFDTIIRFSGRKGQNEKDFGAWTDYIVTSVRHHADVIIEGTRPRGQVWMSCRPQQVDHALAMYFTNERLKGYEVRFLRETWPWYYQYRDFGATGYIDPRQGEPGMIPAFTRGMSAIISACHRLNPKKLHLVGFDNLKAGSSENYTEVQALQEGEAPRKTNHDMVAERKLLELVANRYDVQVVFA